MKKIVLAIFFTFTLILNTTVIVFAAPFDLTYSADNTKNYTFNQFIDSPSVFDFVASNLAGYEIEGLDGIKYSAQEINNRTMLGMDFVQAVASIKATAAVATAEGSLLQADVDIAQALITALPNGTDKTALQNRLNIVIALIPVVPPAPAVSNNDIANTVSGMATGMEYKLDSAGYAAYVAGTFNLIDFSGNHTLLVRVAAVGINPPSLDTTLTFTTNPGPPVTNDDVADSVFGMTTEMEYSYDGAAYVLYDAFGFNFASLNFHGEHILLVRYAANPTGPVTTLLFTLRPGPAVINDDAANTVTGMSTAMEYNLDGAGYVTYAASTFNALDFNGNHNLLVRYKADPFLGHPASLATTLTFTTNPGPQVTNNDLTNTVTGMTTAMEYNLDNTGYVLYDALIFDQIDFSGNHTLLVRVAAEGGNPAGPVATLIFTTNPGVPAAPLVFRDDNANTVTGMAVGMEYNYDGTGYVMYDEFGFVFAGLNFIGDHTLYVRYAAVGQTPASLVTTLTFTTNPVRLGPPVTNNDTDNTVSGMDSTMEYSYDGAAYVMYDNFFGPDVVFGALDFTGNHTLLVRYSADIMNGWPPSLDTTLTFTTNPVTLSSIAITTPATKLIYTVGEMLDIAGMVVTGTYSDSSTQIETITAANITGFNSAAPALSQTLTITVGTRTTTFNISISPVPVTLSSIAVTTPATKLTYLVGEALDLTGLVVTGTYSDGSTMVEPITAANIIGFNSAAPAVTQTLTITFGGKTTTFNISISPVPVTLSSIAVTTPATKLAYFVGDALDLTGLVVTGTYSDGSTMVEPITAANLTGFNSAVTAANQTLTITVGIRTVTYAISIAQWPVEIDNVAVNFVGIVGKTYANININAAYVSQVNNVIVNGVYATLQPNGFQWRVEVPNGTTINDLQGKIIVQKNVPLINTTSALRDFLAVTHITVYMLPGKTAVSVTANGIALTYNAGMGRWEYNSGVMTAGTTILIKVTDASGQIDQRTITVVQL